jgi:heme/copper-type cytochrome/quinol oxidase subunit 3
MHTTTDDLAPTNELTPGRLATWLFLASQVMLFGALFATYFVLRSKAPSAWPHYALSLVAGGLATLAVAGSASTMAKAAIASREDRDAEFRKWSLVTLALGAILVVIEVVQIVRKIPSTLPAASTFRAFHDLMTGLHTLEVIASLAGLAYLVRSWPRTAQREALREGIRNLALMWQFLCGLWGLLFVVFYLS